MIKFIFFLVGLFIALILILFYLDSKKRIHDSLKNEVLNLTLTAITLNIVYSLGFVTSSLLVYKLISCVCYSLNLVLAYLILDFLAKYAKEDYKDEYKCLIRILIVLSIVLVFSNLVKPWGAVNYQVKSLWGADFFILVRNEFTYLRQILPVGIGINTLCITVKNMFKERGIFKLKYVYLNVVIVLALIINIYIPRVEFYPINLVYLINSLSCVEILYIMMYHSPKILTQKIKSSLLTNSQDGYVAFDADGNFFYQNEASKKVFSDEILANGYSYVCSLLTDVPKENTAYNYEINIDGKIYYYKIYHAVLTDSKERPQAYYFTLHDITSESQELIAKDFIITHDNLTKAYNRERFFIEATKKVESRPNDTWYLVVTNFENFRLYNDLYGTKEGDKLLLEMRDFMGTLDHQIPYCYARMSGDMFAAIMTNVEYETFDYGNAAINYFKPYESRHVILRVAVCEVAHHTISEAFERANQTIHYYHNSLTDRVAFYTSSINAKFVRESGIISALDEGMNKNEFMVYYQPQIDSISNRLSGAEALVRWNSPSLGFVSPGEFIPIFEKKGVITKLDLFVWEEVCSFLNRLSLTPYKDLSISINISRLDFYHIDVVKVLVDLCAKYNISHSKLKLEVTESAFTENQDLVIKEVKRLQEEGFMIEVDDFGSGYSSLNVLKDMSIDIMKLDMKFMEDSNNIKAKVIVGKMISLAHELHFPVIAEGVETLEQVKMLLDMGCNIIQGYYFSKPIPESDFLEYVKLHGLTNRLNEFMKDRFTLYTFTKDIDKYYGNMPCALVILSPTKAKSDEVQDYTAIYQNKCFKEQFGAYLGNVVGEKASKFGLGVKISFLPSLRIVSKTRKDMYFPKIKINGKEYELYLLVDVDSDNILVVIK